MSLIKNSSELEKISRAGKILKTTLAFIKTKIKPGITSLELDRLANEFIINSGGLPSFLNYRQDKSSAPYPNTICASNNEIIVHGLPNNESLKSGDTFSVDIGVSYDGYNADSAFTIGIGEISKQAKNLIRVTQKALSLGIKAAKPKNTIGDIGFAIGSYVHSQGLYIVSGLTGHGIGKALHEPPQILNEGKPKQGIEIKTGMVFAIEPMVAVGSKTLIQAKDGSFKTSDNSLSAHFEHTIIITETGAKIIT